LLHCTTVTSAVQGVLTAGRDGQAELLHCTTVTSAVQGVLTAGRDGQDELFAVQR